MKILHKALLLAAIPLLVLALIDPLEGGLALMGAGLVYVIAYSVTRTRPKAYLWIPFLGAVATGALVLVLALTIRTPQGTPEPAWLTVLAGNWIYRAFVVVTTGGAVVTAVKSFTVGRPRL